jgi:hypothetical protein
MQVNRLSIPFKVVITEFWAAARQTHGCLRPERSLVHPVFQPKPRMSVVSRRMSKSNMLTQPDTEEQKNEFRSKKSALVAHAKQIDDQMNDTWGLFFTNNPAQKMAKEMFKNHMAQFIKDERLLKGSKARNLPAGIKLSLGPRFYSRMECRMPVSKTSRLKSRLSADGGILYEAV